MNYRNTGSRAGPVWLRRALAICLLGAGLNGASAFAMDDAAAPPDSGMEIAAEAAATLPADFEGLVRALVEADFEQRGELVRRIAALDDARKLAVLEPLLDGRLYSESPESTGAESALAPRIVALGVDGSDPEAVDVLSGESLGPSSALLLDSVPVNNSLRGLLRNLIARQQLTSADTGLRQAAARRLISAEPDADLLPVLERALTAESNRSVARALATVIAMARMDSEEAAVRASAVATLSGALYPEVRGRLQEAADNDDSPAVRAAAVAALDSIQDKLAVYRFLENLFFGLSLGSVLLLAAIGLAITFGVMGVINMAHGELIMLGAYTTYVMQQFLPQHIGASLLLSIPMAFLVSGLVGVAIERGVIRFLYGRPLETLLATFGISLILQQAVRSIFSPLNREVASPAWMSGALEINPVWSLTYNRLAILLFALAVFVLILLVMKRTSLGLKLRAVAQNRAMARAVGVRASWVDALTFGLGSGIAGVAGVALSQLTNVGPNLGQGYIIDSFMVVVFGGVGNLWGTLVGAMGLGIFNKFLEPYAGAVLAKILVLVFIILFIQKRPRGLFPQKGRAADA